VSAENLLSLNKNSYNARATLSCYVTDKGGPPAWGLGEGVTIQFTSPCDNSKLQSVIHGLGLGEPLRTDFLNGTKTSGSIKYSRNARLTVKLLASQKGLCSLKRS